MKNKASTRLSYAERIERAVEYLFDHLDGETDLVRLAEEACLSPFHFHRVYHGMTGETVAETLRRLRLHRAALKLISSETPVAALAREAGYGSAAAFGRAFARDYGVPPAEYRAKQTRALLRERTAALHHPAQEKQMFEVLVREVEPVRVVALPHRGDYMNIGQEFESLLTWAAGRGLNDPAVGANARCFGLYYDDPAAVPAKDLRSEACVAMPTGDAVPSGGKIRHTAGGRCAMLVFKGPYSSLETPYRWLFGTWLPASGEEPREAPCFEEYLNDARSTPPAELLTAIYLPLKD